MEQLLQEIKEILLRQQLNDREWLSSKEAAMYMGVSLDMIYQLTSQGKLSHSKPSGKLIFFKKSDLDAFLQQNYFEGLSSF
jgi:excisionase family DNA binding protein